MASSDYHEDVRVSEEILERTVDAYRKIRNTARYALGNLHGFEPSKHSVPEADLLEIDRWVLAELDDVVARVWRAYETYEFHMATRAIYSFCTVTLSARYFDIIKDRLYTSAPGGLARRSAQTALYRIAEALARLLAPILVFTSDEIWENLPANTDRSASVHLAVLPSKAAEQVGDELRTRWERLFQIRDNVLQSLEEARNSKVIGSSLEARVELSASGDTYELLAQYRDELRYVFIVSQVDVKRADGAGDALAVKVSPAHGQKCERCWNYSTRVGESSRYPSVCERCVEALEEIERDGASRLMVTNETQQPSRALTTRFGWRAGYLLAAFGIYMIDQVTKAWAARTLRHGDDRTIISGFFDLVYTENPGIAFGQLQGGGSIGRWFFVVLAILAAVAVFYYFLRTPRNDDRVLGACALLLAGILGNLTDRARLGYVIDFIALHAGQYHWPTFNIADASITIGALLLAYDVIFQKPVDSSQ